MLPIHFPIPNMDLEDTVRLNGCWANLKTQWHPSKRYPVHNYLVMTRHINIIVMVVVHGQFHAITE